MKLGQTHSLETRKKLSEATKRAMLGNRHRFGKEKATTNKATARAIRYYERSHIGPKRQGIYSWGVSGSRARGVMMTLYPMMSARRKAQMARGIAQFAPLPHPSQPSTQE